MFCSGNNVLQCTNVLGLISVILRNTCFHISYLYYKIVFSTQRLIISIYAAESKKRFVYIMLHSLSSLLGTSVPRNPTQEHESEATVGIVLRKPVSQRS